jgi:hypothetical protein
VNKLILVLATLLLLPAFVSAHPGRTASDGCNYCRSNCEKWGVPRGEKHCHNRESEPLQISVIKQGDENITNFRKSLWGMSKKETNSSEKLKKLDENPDQLFYEGKVGGLETYKGILYF